MATTVTLKPNAIDLSGSTSGTTTLQASAVAGTTTVTLPAATDTLVGKATTDTLTNKTLTSPTMTAPVLGTPASGTVTNLTGTASININGTVGATTPAAGSFTSLAGGASGTGYSLSASAPAGSLVLDAYGQLGLATTPKTWLYTYGTRAFQFCASGALAGLDVSDSDRRVYLMNNAYIKVTTGAQTYINNGAATAYEQSAGNHVWRTAPSGTAGDSITFTDRMTLTSTGLNSTVIGATTPAAGSFTTVSASDGTVSAPSYSFASSSNTGFFYSANTLKVSIGGVQRAEYGTGYFVVPHTCTLGFGTFGVSVDVSFGYNAAGVIEVNSGTLGDYRDLKIRNLTATGTLSATSTIKSDDGTNGTFQIGALATNLIQGGSSYAGITYRVPTGSAHNFTVNSVNVISASSTGLAVTGALSATGITSTSDTTDATSTTAASLKTAGGLAVVKKAWIGDTLTTTVNSSQNALRLERSTGTPSAAFTINFGSNYTNCDSSDRYILIAGGSGGVYLASGGTSWTSNSDERLKNIIEPIIDAVAKVNTLRSVIGTFKADPTTKRRSFLIAQDLVKVLPEAVDQSDPEHLGVQYTDVIPLLVAAIKELSADFTTYKKAHP